MNKMIRVYLVFLSLTITISVFAQAQVPLTGTLKFEYEPGKCVERLIELLTVESKTSEKAKEEGCDKQEEEIKKQMFGANVKEKATLRGKLRKIKSCYCKVNKISFKKKREILEMAIEKLKDEEAKLNCEEQK